MLSRGLLDTLSLWPAVFWPIFYSSCFWAFVRLCQNAHQRWGFSLLTDKRPVAIVAKYSLLPLACMIEVATHAYMFMVVGYFYVIVIIPIYIFGWVLLPTILDGFKPAFGVLGAAYAGFVVSFAVLLGLWDVRVVRAVNSDIYGLLVGVPINL